MWSHTYFKALKGVNWWPVTLLVGVMFIAVAAGSYLLERHTAISRVPAAQQPVRPSELREEPPEVAEPVQYVVPVESVETATQIEQDTSTPTVPERVSRDVASGVPKPAEIVRQINEARRASGLSAVTEDSLLDKSASLKVTDMIVRNYWAHSAPDGSGPWATIQRVGYPYSYVGENLAYGQYGSASPERTIVQNWLKSSGHRKNMLNSQFKDIGIAVQKANSYNGRQNVYVIVTQYGTKR